MAWFGRVRATARRPDQDGDGKLSRHERYEAFMDEVNPPSPSPSLYSHSHTLLRLPTRTIRPTLYLSMPQVSHWSPIVFAVLLTLVIAPPLVLTYVILPCWECADFEAAILHEAGHFFGLGHPDNVPRWV